MIHYAPDYLQEIATIEVSRLQREAAMKARWVGICIDAGETELALELDAEVRAMANGTEMGEAA